jgi:CheY-like chemotaxis protein
MAPAKQILVVDDNPTVRKFITGVLQPMGYQVSSAKDGLEALAKVARVAPDLILLDLVMPRLNGYQFVKALEQKKLAENAKIVILSSAREEVARKVKAATRVDEALPKPVKAQQLKALVMKYLPITEKPLTEEPQEEDEIEFDLGESEAPISQVVTAERLIESGGPIDISFGDEVTSDDTVSSPLDLVGILRDKLDTAVAEGLAIRLDEILQASSRDELLGLMAEVLAGVVNDKLVQRMIDLVRSVNQDRISESEPE